MNDSSLFLNILIQNASIKVSRTSSKICVLQLLVCVDASPIGLQNQFIEAEYVACAERNAEHKPRWRYAQKYLGGVIDAKHQKRERGGVSKRFRQIIYGKTGTRRRKLKSF